MKHRRPQALFAFAVISALLLGACSSGGDKADSTTSTTATADDGTTTTEGGAGDEEDETSTTVDDDDDVEVSGSGRDFVDAMTESMLADEESPLSEEQARCFSERFVAGVGVDRFQAAGITPEMLASDDGTLEFTELNLSEAEGNDLYDNFARCDIDLRALMLESMALEEDMTPAMQSCMEGVLTDDNLRKLMVMTMTQGSDALEDDAAGSELVSGIMGCAFMGLDMDDIEIETGALGEG